MSHAYKFRPHVGTLNIRPPSAARPFLGILPSRLRIKDKRRFGTAFSALFGKSRMEINTNNSLSSAYSRRPSIPPSFPAFHHLGVLSVRFCITNSGTVGSPLSALMHSQSRVHISHNRHLAYRLRTPPPLTIRLFLCVWSFRLCITYSARFALLCLLFPSHYHALTSIRISLPFCRLQSLHILTCILSRLLLSQSCVNSYSNISALFADSHLRSFRPPGLARLPAGVMSFWLYIISLPRHVLIYLLFLL